MKNFKVANNRDSHHYPSTPAAIEQSSQDMSGTDNSVIEPPWKRARFEAVPDEALEVYQLPTEMESLVKKHTTCFINENVLNDTILIQNPVPSNV